jgi:sugar (pentulose or hexulose) kinase
LENICFAIKANLLQLETISGLKTETISIGGNLTKSQCLRQILPAILSRQVRFGQVAEVSGLGAAICAAAGSGIHSSVTEAMASMKSELTVAEPDPLTSDEYDEHYHKWLHTIQQLQKMSEVTK